MLNITRVHLLLIFLNNHLSSYLSDNWESYFTKVLPEKEISTTVDDIMKFKKNIGSMPNQSNLPKPDHNSLQTSAIKIPGEKENSLSESLQDNKNPRKDQDQEEDCKVDYTELYPYDNRKLWEY